MFLIESTTIGKTRSTLYDVDCTSQLEIILQSGQTEICNWYGHKAIFVLTVPIISTDKWWVSTSFAVNFWQRRMENWQRKKGLTEKIWIWQGKLGSTEKNEFDSEKKENLNFLCQFWGLSLSYTFFLTKIDLYDCNINYKLKSIIHVT